MRTLVTYHTQTGNTKKVAEAIYGALEGEREIAPMEKVDDLSGYDLAFVGFPVHAHTAARPAAEFLEGKCQGKCLALFMNHATPEDAADLFAMIDRCTVAAAGAQVVGVFNCQGELADDVMEKLLKSDHPQMQMFGEQGKFTQGQPDASRLERAAAFARQVAAKL